MSRTTSRTLALTAAFFSAVLLSPLGALAQTGSEETQGAQLLQSVQQGDKGCSDLSNSDFELVGESWMGRVFGNSQAHESMNRLMAAMMGSSGEVQMHEYMGRRVAGCGGGTVPGSFGRLMGMMAMMGGQYGYGAGTSSGQGNSGQGYGPGMMDGVNSFNQTGSNDDSDNGGAGWFLLLMVGMMAALIVAALIVRRRSGSGARGGSALEILDRRLAAGEIERDEYNQRRSLLGGGS